MRSTVFSFFCIITLGTIFLTYAHASPSKVSEPEIVHFKNKELSLGGLLYRPKGKGPFPAVLYNHGSAPGMLNNQAAEAIGPKFAEHGWVFFMPYRRGQGLSQSAGPYIGHEIDTAGKNGGTELAASTMVRLLKADHLEDQLAALSWLKNQGYVDKAKIAVDGNSFGGVESVLGASKAFYCAAVNASGGAQSWQQSKELQTLMKQSVRDANCPILFIQAENDFDTAPSRVLSQEMKTAGKVSEIKIYPKFGNSSEAGHSFAYRGVETWFPDAFEFLQRHCMSQQRTSR